MKWMLPKYLLYFCSLTVVITTMVGVFWLFFKFNIPYVNSGDQAIMRAIAFFYWIVISMLIWGVDLKDDSTQ